ncbi:MAG: AI-2 transport protein TqsA [Kiritimatiellia bacterium]|jgi:AI-2 transport protein TqsA
MQTSSSPIARFLIITAAFIIVVAGMRAAESLLIPFFLSLFIAIICTPLLRLMQRYRIPTGVSILLIVVMMVVVGIFIGAIVGSSINSFTADIPLYQARLVQLSLSLQEWLAGMGLAIDSQLWKEVVNPSAALTMAGNTLSSFGNIMTDGFLILLTVMFILAEEVNFSDKFRHASNSSEKTLEALSRFAESINTYMAIKTLVSFATGVLLMFALMIIGVDYPVLWGMLAFMLNFIPTFGSILAAVPPVLLAIVQLGFGEALMTAALYISVNIVVGSVLEPRFMGKGLDLSSLVVFLSLVFWGWILGPVGMLLSVPLTIMVKIALENSPDTHWLGVMLGSGANVPEAEVPETEVPEKEMS